MLRIYLTLTYFLDIIVLKIRIYVFIRIIMKKIGVIKEIDALGRLHIPKEIRARLGFDKSVELVLTDKGLLIKSIEYKLIKAAEETESEYSS